MMELHPAQIERKRIECPHCRYPIDFFAYNDQWNRGERVLNYDNLTIKIMSDAIQNQSKELKELWKALESEDKRNMVLINRIEVLKTLLSYHNIPYQDVINNADKRFGKED